LQPTIRNIETIFRDDSPGSFFSLRRFLYAVSLVYGIIAEGRRYAYTACWLSRKKLPCLVISIGNLTVGGTGKTPMTIYLAQWVSSLGYRVAIVSRGYRGKSEKKGAIVSNGNMLLLSAKEAGDEPFLMGATLKEIPIVVGQNRYRAGLLAINAFSPDVILLDDGFQHLKLHRDIDLVLVDHDAPFGNGHLLPRGPLREPTKTITEADAIVETRCQEKEGASQKLVKVLHPHSIDAPVFQCSALPFVSKIISASKSIGKNHLHPLQKSHPLPEKRAVVFSGIAHNDGFQKSIIEMGCEILAAIEFKDHHQYSESDFVAIQRMADEMKAECLITTEKDAVKIPKGRQWSVDLIVMGVRMDFGNQTRPFQKWVEKILSERIPIDRRSSR
jgi:tetraacyldisaccharide 4'-kinase